MTVCSTHQSVDTDGGPVTVLVVHVDADEALARDELVEPLRAAGFQVFYGGDVLVGESTQVEIGKVLERGSLVVICGTHWTAGSRKVHQYVRSARARSAGVRIFGVQMAPDANLEPLALDGKVAVWWENKEKALDDLVAALRRYGFPGSDEPAGPRERIHLSGRYGFTQRVAEACEDRYRGADVKVVRTAGADRLEYLAVRWRDEQGYAVHWPVGLLPLGLDDDAFERFVESVHADYERDDPRTPSEIVYSGSHVDHDFVDRARRRGVKVWSLVEYERRWDSRPYLERQERRLDADIRYPPDLYVPQRFVRLDGHRPSRLPVEPGDLLGATLGWLDCDDARLIIVLGDFGHGKSFLLRQLARRIPSELPHLVPMLVELRDIDKINNLDVLLAQHLAKVEEDRIDVRAVRQMLARGQVALLFDGFDELAVRITYDEAAAHLRTVASAVTDQAKVVLTSRTQHFRSDDQWRTGLGEQVHIVTGRREVRLVEFDQAQIRAFLVKLVQLRGGLEKDADERLALIHDIKDLQGLSKNARMLSFIADLPVEDLQAAKDRSGQISSADLYRLLVDRWLTFEVHRRFELDRAGQGSHGTETRQRYRAQLRSALDALAVTLWEITEQGVNVARLEQVAAETLLAWKELRFDQAQAAQALGSGGLLVRTGDDTFGFIHSSVMEYLVAAQAARLDAGQMDTQLLASWTMTPLMADFFCGIAGRDAALSWARKTMVTTRTSLAARANALVVGTHLGVPLDGVDLAGQDLRDHDLTDRDLTGAKLTGVILTGARLRGTNLTGATLAGADLSYATLDGVTLADADLTGANFTGATVRRGTLRGARVEGSMWVRAALVGTEVDPDERLTTGPLSAAIRADVEPADSMILPTMLKVSGVAFSRDGTWLAAAGADVVLIDTRTWRVVRVLPGHREWVWSVGFDSAGARLATGGDDGTVRIWETSTGRELRELTGHHGTVRSVGFDSAGARLATGGDDGTVRIWETTTGRELRQLTGHHGSGWPVSSVGFDPTGTHLASGGDDGILRVWDADTGQLLNQLTGHRESVESVGFGAAGARLASGSADGTVRIWDTGTGRLRHWLTGHDGPVWSVGFDSAGTRLATGGDEGTVRIWETVTGRELHQLGGHDGPVWSVGFDSAGTRLASGGDEGTVRIWETVTGRELHQLGGHDGPVWSVGFDSAGTRLATGGDDGTVRIWETTTGRQLHQLGGHVGSVLSMGFDPAGTRLATGDEGTVRIWDADTGRLIHQPVDYTGPVMSVGFDPAGTRLTSIGADGSVRIWDALTGRLQRLFTGHEGRGRSVGFDPTGSRLASGHTDGIVRVWDFTTAALLARMLALPEGGWATLLPDGSYKLAGDPSGRFWWVIGSHRFEAGELDDISPYVCRFAVDDPIPGMGST